MFRAPPIGGLSSPALVAHQDITVLAFGKD
jgi:hypothetical protein